MELFGSLVPRMNVVVGETELYITETRPISRKRISLELTSYDINISQKFLPCKWCGFLRVVVRLGFL